MMFPHHVRDADSTWWALAQRSQWRQWYMWLGTPPIKLGHNFLIHPCFIQCLLHASTPTVWWSTIRAMWSSNIIAIVILFEYGHGEYDLNTSSPKVITHAELICQSQRPTTMEARIHPSALNDHRISHRMLGPCCLCPMLDASAPDFVEAVIDMDPSGKHAGQYVAACAKDRCGYLGKSSQCAHGPCKLDRFWSHAPSSAFGTILQQARPC